MPQYKIKRKEQYSSNKAEPSLLVYLYLLVYGVQVEAGQAGEDDAWGRDKFFALQQPVAVTAFVKETMRQILGPETRDIVFSNNTTTATFTVAQKMSAG